MPTKKLRKGVHEDEGGTEARHGRGRYREIDLKLVKNRSGYRDALEIGEKIQHNHHDAAGDLSGNSIASSSIEFHRNGVHGCSRGGIVSEYGGMFQRKPILSFRLVPSEPGFRTNRVDHLDLPLAFLVFGRRKLILASSSFCFCSSILFFKASICSAA
jgi:hypothetical protein